MESTCAEQLQERSIGDKASGRLRLHAPGTLSPGQAHEGRVCSSAQAPQGLRRPTRPAQGTAVWPMSYGGAAAARQRGGADRYSSHRHTGEEVAPDSLACGCVGCRTGPAWPGAPDGHLLAASRRGPLAAWICVCARDHGDGFGPPRNRLPQSHCRSLPCTG